MYAEDPAKGFLPSVWRLDWLLFPEATVGENANAPALYLSDDVPGGAPVRVDAGVRYGDVITPYYDPMIAKIIAHGSNRVDAIESLGRAMGDTFAFPLRTNAGFAARLLAQSDFKEGRIDTGFIERTLAAIAPRPPIPPAAAALAARMLARGEHNAPGWTVYAPATMRAVREAPWLGLPGFRLNAEADRSAWVEVDGQSVEVDLERADASTSVVMAREEGVVVAEAGETYLVTLPAISDFGGGRVTDGALLAPMPGRIVSVDVAEGTAVTAGQKLVVLEAMKMEQALVAPFDGVVAELRATAGAQVTEGALLARIERVGDA